MTKEKFCVAGFIMKTSGEVTNVRFPPSSNAQQGFEEEIARDIGYLTDKLRVVSLIMRSLTLTRNLDLFLSCA